MHLGSYPRVNQKSSFGPLWKISRELVTLVLCEECVWWLDWVVFLDLDILQCFVRCGRASHDAHFCGLCGCSRLVPRTCWLEVSVDVVLE